MSSSTVLALGDLLSDFEVKQRKVLLLSIDKAIENTMKKQSELLHGLKSDVETRHCVAMDDYRNALTRTLPPSLVELMMNKTLSVETNAGLVSWIHDEGQKSQAREYITKLRSHLESGHGNAFRSDFEGLLRVYMDYLNISTTRGSRLACRIEDLHQALYLKADYDDNLVNLVYRVRWGCQGVRSIGNARSHHASPLVESEILELCGCLSALGAAMPQLALEFNVCKPIESPTLSPVSSDGGLSTSHPSPEDRTTLQQPTQATRSKHDDVHSPLNYILQLMATNGRPVDATRPSSTYPSNHDSTEHSVSLRFPSGLRPNTVASQAVPTGSNRLSFPMPNLSGLDLTNLGSIGSSSSRDAPALAPGYNDTNGSVWSQPPLPPSSESPQKPLRSPSVETPLPYLFWSKSPRKSSLQPPIESPHASLQQPSTAFALKPLDVPTPASLALIPTFSLYHNRPTELPKESDRVRKAMFARMLNHMNELPKATLCPLPPGHDLTCPLSHTYMEVMTYNPLYKRLICRQPSHYWGSQLQEDDSCVCLHIDTGLSWDWMDEAKRLFCLRGANCTNSKCYKSHTFEEMCWYNPSYKIKRCTVRTHDHIARARGSIEPPLECSYYHIEEGKNCDKRDFTAEYDHVGVDVQMLFTERTHKLLADRLEAVRYARANNL